MTKDQCLKLLVEARETPAFGRNQWFKIQQQKSGYTQDVFVQFMKERIRSLDSTFDRKIAMGMKAGEPLTIYGWGYQPTIHREELKEFEQFVNDAFNLSPGHEIQPAVEEYLKYFKGRINNKQLLSEKQYQYVLDLTIKLITTGKCPPDAQPIDKVGSLPFSFIRRTYHILHTKFEGREINDEWITFLLTLFEYYTDSEFSTVKKNFSKEDNYTAIKNSITTD